MKKRIKKLKNNNRNKEDMIEEKSTLERIDELNKQLNKNKVNKNKLGKGITSGMSKGVRFLLGCIAGLVSTVVVLGLIYILVLNFSFITEYIDKNIVGDSVDNIKKETIKNIKDSQGLGEGEDYEQHNLDSFNPDPNNKNIDVKNKEE